MIVAADDVGDAHVMIVDHHREHVGRGAVRAQQDEIVELGILHRHPALDEIVDDRLAIARRFQANDERLVGLFVADVPPRAFDAEGPPLGLRLLALRGQFLLRHVAAIGVPALEHLVGDLGMARPELRLIIFVAVPIEPEPAQAVEDHVDRLVGRPRLVGILDPEQRFAAVVPREQPGEQARPRIADVQQAGR